MILSSLSWLLLNLRSGNLFNVSSSFVLASDFFLYLNIKFFKS